MADAGRDLLRAAGAEVGLASLKGVDVPDLDRAGDAFVVIEAPRGGRVQAHSSRVTAIDDVPACKRSLLGPVTRRASDRAEPVASPR
jgi:hypothetical protein